MELRMFAVEGSSNVEAVGYRAAPGGKDAGTLRVRFRGGAAYDYEGVGLDVLSAFLNAPSMGSYLAANLRGQFETRKVAGANVEHEQTASGVTVIRPGKAGGRDVTPGGCR